MSMTPGMSSLKCCISYLLCAFFLLHFACNAHGSLCCSTVASQFFWVFLIQNPFLGTFKSVCCIIEHHNQTTTVCCAVSGKNGPPPLSPCLYFLFHANTCPLSNHSAFSLHVDISCRTVASRCQGAQRQTFSARQTSSTPQ